MAGKFEKIHIYNARGTEVLLELNHPDMPKDASMSFDDCQSHYRVVVEWWEHRENSGSLVATLPEKRMHWHIRMFALDGSQVADAFMVGEWVQEVDMSILPNDFKTARFV